MMQVRQSEERGKANFGWLDSRHSFSFGDYHDPRHMGFGPLRVINEDWVKPGAGFDTHGHQDMEIVTYVLDGALEHKDSLGTGSVIRPGEVQRMTAGTGIRHSEYNPSKTEPVHLLQIWILPEQGGLTPSYEQKNFPAEDLQGRLRLVASPDGRDGSVHIHQNAAIYAARLGADERIEVPVVPGRRYWLQIARGAVQANGAALKAGDGAAISEEAKIALASTEGGTEVLLFDLP